MLSNNIKHFIKIIPFTFTIAAFSLVITQNALATSGERIPQHQKPGTDIIQAINNLGNKMEAIALAGEKTTTQLANAVDKEISSAIMLNTEKTSADNIAITKSTQTIQNTIHTNLAQFPNEILTYTSNIDPAVQQSQTEKSAQDNLMDTLSLGVSASDTLYSAVSNIEAATPYTQYSQAKPDVNNDRYFDVNTLIGTDSYTRDQQQAAQYFITYLTKQYQSLTEGVNFAELRNYLNQFINDPVTLGEKLQEFRDNDDYKKFQLTERSATAAQSVSLNVYNTLLAERTPLQSQDKNPDPKLEAISQLMGVKPQQITVPDPNNPGQTMTVWSYVSPLQINNYMANHRINDPKWYQEVASGSAEDLLRSLNKIMAESESLAQQSHLDNEKILTALATLNIQSAQMNQLLNTHQLQNINAAIDSITGQGSTTATPTNTNNTANTDTSSTTNPEEPTTVPTTGSTTVPTTPPTN